MSGAFGGKPATPAPPPTPAPTPTPEPDVEMKDAEKRTRRKGYTGRESTILAGRLNSQRGKSLLGE